MQSHPLHTQHGFSLIEMLIALVVLSIALLGMSRASVSMITVHTANERLARASALLQDRMETLKHSGYSGVATVNVEDVIGGNATILNCSQAITDAVRNRPVLVLNWTQT